MKKKTLLMAIVFVLALALIAIGTWQFYRLRFAHSTFQNYYNFRGCVQLLEKTDTYGRCKVASGETIKIVLIDGTWYLDGDGPGMW